MKLNYKQKLFLWFVVIFTAFTAVILLLERKQERNAKTSALTARLDAYAALTDRALEQGESLDSLTILLPPGLRLTVLDLAGGVLYDNTAPTRENHANRPEVAKASENGSGTSVRTSATDGVEYLYYAKRLPDRYIRVALPYDLGVRRILKADNLFLYWILALLAAMLLVINYVAGLFGKSIDRLRDFASLAGQYDKPIPGVSFPEDELGEIGARIAESYRQISESRQSVAREREKLLQHIHSSQEGICFFTPDRQPEFWNGLFIQYLNTISNQSDPSPATVLDDPAFAGVAAFLTSPAGAEKYFETRIDAQGKHFTVRANRFDDGSLELILNDVTTKEKNRRLKQEMTGNIAHELRTPVTAIRGYLETLSQQSLPAEKQRQFLEKAFGQSVVLSELIADMSLITRIEEAPQSFSMEPVAVTTLLEGLRDDLSEPLIAREMKMEWNIWPTVSVLGNRNLLYSIFRNLTDNAIRYAGKGSSIRISIYNEDNAFYYFSYADNGVGIPGEEHLPRLFERFYRISEGRTRDTGGSGLGLSIVRNAVAFHRGSITAKNAPNGGLEFLFKLPKSK